MATLYSVLRIPRGWLKSGITVVALLGFSLSLSLAAHASVAVLLEEPYGAASHLSPSGHVALYLDNVCTETPVVLRRCHSGELGSVISRYDGVDDRDWIAIPLTGYLYSVERTDEIPLRVNRKDVSHLREAYRRQFLMSLVPDRADGTAPGGNWYELAGAAYDRTIYEFEVTSTPEQDAALIAFLNGHENRDAYNGAVRNCADFVRVIVNRFYPHAIHRNYVADFGLTSPKSVARGLAHYAAKHPEIRLATFRIPQVSGTLPRSHPAVTLTEGIVKEFGIPLLILSPPAAGLVLAAYLTQGRFAEPKRAPVLNLRTDVTSPRPANTSEDSAKAAPAPMQALHIQAKAPHDRRAANLSSP